jgi:hypothetical protein
VSGVLLADLSHEQLLLLRGTFTPWSRMGRWPIWAYVDQRLDAEGLVAADVLASLPGVGEALGGRALYGLTWYVTSGSRVPAADTPVALTVAGLRHLGTDSAQLLASFMDTLRFLVKKHRSIEPDPYEVKTESMTSQELARWLVQTGLFNPAVDVLVSKVGQLLQHEPHFGSGFRRSAADGEPWNLEIRDSIREYRDVATIEEYIERVEQMVSPPEAPSQPFTATPLDIPYSVNFADAVWESRTRSALFARPDPASIARLTQPCDSEGAFNSLMSALADVLGQVAKPGTGKAPRNGALEEVRRYLDSELDPAAADRCSAAIGTLIELRTVRHSIEHGDARAKAVAAYANVGISVPVMSWPDAWGRVAALACGALDVLREEAHAGLDRQP